MCCRCICLNDWICAQNIIDVRDFDREVWQPRHIPRAYLCKRCELIIYVNVQMAQELPACDWVIPLKWKKWLLARALFSCSSIMRSIFGCKVAVLCTLNPKRQVGQLVSCSSHDCKHELQINKANILVSWFLAGTLQEHTSCQSTYLWNKCEHGNLRAVSIFSQQMAQLSEFCDRSSAVASG